VTSNRGAKTGRDAHRTQAPSKAWPVLWSVLRSKRAVSVNIEIMRTFVRLRELLASNADLARRLDDLEKKYDGQFRVVFDAIRQLMTPPPAAEKRAIGFHVTAHARAKK
jgi:hypothetical protein